MESLTVRASDLDKYGNDLKQLRLHSLERMQDPEYARWVEEEEKRISVLEGKSVEEVYGVNT